MDTLLFVYGTLKEGFPNFPRNSGKRVPGTFRTRIPFPLYVVCLPYEDRAPWLVDRPGEGHQVVGQVFRVDDALLRAMDVFEEVGLPTGYVRTPIELEPLGAAGAPRVLAHAYVKPPSHLAECLSVHGPFAEYTHELALGYDLRSP